MKSMLLLRVFAASLCTFGILLGSQAEAQTEVTEDIQYNTTWDISGSPYVIMKPSGRILIAQGATLTIEPGVRVEFPGNASTIANKGTLNAIGTSENPIVFTRADGFDGYWYTIEFNGSDGKGVGTLEHCIIEGGGATAVPDTKFDAAINCIYAAAPIIKHCTIKDSYNGIYSTKESLPVIQNNTIEDCERYGLYLDNSSPEISGNIIRGNGLGGVIQVTIGDGSTYPQYDNNTFGATDFILLTGTQQHHGTWEYAGTPYYINEELKIQAGVTLTIEPGVDIRFMKETDQLVVRGNILAKGTAQAPILLTRDPDYAGYWRGLDFSGTDVNSTEFEHVIIEYSGFDLGNQAFVGAIRCVNSASPKFTNVTLRNNVQGIFCHTNANPVIDQCQIVDNNEFGIYIVNAEPTITNNTVQGNGSGGVFQHTLASGKAYPKYEGNTFGPNNRIHLRGNADQNGTIEYAGTPYVISQTMIVQDIVTLTVEAGVEFQFMNAADKLTVLGTLLVEGASGNEVLFTRAPELSGTWRGIEFSGAGSSNSQIDYATFEYGGGAIDEYSNDAIVSCINEAAPTFDHCTIRESQNGIYCFNKATPLIKNSAFTGNNRYGLNFVNSSPTIENCTINSNSAGGLALNTSGTGSTYPTYINNTWSADNRIHVIGNVRESGTWKFANTPYVVKDEFRIDNGATLTLEPGVTIQFLNSISGMKVNNSRLVAIGTHDDPITFTRSPELAESYWNQLLVFGATAEESAFQHCVFEYGGFTILPGDRVGMIAADAGAAPTIKKCIIKNSDNIGVYANDGAEPEIWSSMIFDNAEYGVYNNQRNIVVDAKECWWGDPSGPYDPSNLAEDPTGLHNPNGLGNRVTNYVDYSNWLTMATSTQRVRASVETFALHQNYPNPFNPSTTIVFALNQTRDVRLEIFDAVGQRIATLLDSRLPEGPHTVQWNASHSNGQPLPTGTYFYRLSSGNSQVTKAMTLSK